MRWLNRTKRLQISYKNNSKRIASIFYEAIALCPVLGYNEPGVLKSYFSLNFIEKWGGVVLFMDEMRQNPQSAEQTAAPSQAVRPYRTPARQRYIGVYTHTVDAKGRVVVPQAFREMLGGNFYIAPSDDFESIALYTEENWMETADRLEQVVGIDGSALSIFYSLSFRDQECDGQGRLLMPTEIRQELLQGEKELIIFGAGDHVNITKAATYRAKFRQVMEEMPSIQKSLSILRARGLRGTADRKEGE